MIAETETAVRLPLWKSAAEDLLAGGLKYGSAVTIEWLEEHLRERQHTVQFNIALHELRDALLRHGFYITERGQNGKQVVVIPAAKNQDVMVSMAHQASAFLRRAVVLGSATNTISLCDDDKRRHEATLERVQIKLALMRRSQSVARIIEKAKPAMLE